MWTYLEQLARDIRYALRQVRRNPAFWGVAIATLALGIGANTAMFSAVDAVLIRPLPYHDAGRLVMIWDDLSHIGFPKAHSTPPEWREWRRHNTVFTDMAATESAQATLSGDGEPEAVPARKVTGNLWTVLGAPPLIGRVFTEDEDTQGVQVVVISFGLWQRRFGASPDVLGRTITLNDKSYQVIGVMPREFYFLPARDIDIWMPAAFSAEHLRMFGWHDVQVVARLAPGVTPEQARESMAALGLRVTAHLDRPRAGVVAPLREELTGKTQTALIVLLSASAAVLLISCVNLANLLMSRGAVRRREVAVRAALGAGRGRLMTQFLIESLVLAGGGAVAGLAVALPVMRFLETLVPQTMAAVRLTLDWRVLAFSAAIAIAAGLTFGLVPALGGSRRALQATLRDGGRGSSARSHWFQHSLIITETALAVALLTSGGLLLQTFQHLRPYTIVGVVKGDQSADQPSGIVVRTAVDPASIVPAVRQAIWSVDRNQPVTRVQTLEDIVARQLSAPSQNTALLGAFALLALLLASLGLYGVLSYAVTQRTNEIGVRMALGATANDILLSFSRRGLALTLAGLAIGAVLAAIAARLMTTLFYGFRPDYVPAVAVVSLVLLAVAALACLVPARRASRIDPMVALQHE